MIKIVLLRPYNDYLHPGRFYWIPDIFFLVSTLHISRIFFRPFFFLSYFYCLSLHLLFGVWGELNHLGDLSRYLVYFLSQKRRGKRKKCFFIYFSLVLNIHLVPSTDEFTTPYTVILILPKTIFDLLIRKSKPSFFVWRSL